MKWNNGRERAIFNKEQAKLREVYSAAGMTEEQIQELYEFDLQNFRLRRTEALHTQNLQISAFDEDETGNEAKNPLLKKFIDKLSIEDKHFESESFGWIENIENKKLYEKIRSLPKKDKELLTLLFIDGYKQTEIASKMGVKKAAVCRKVNRLKNILKSFFEM